MTDDLKRNNTKLYGFITFLVAALMDGAVWVLAAGLALADSGWCRAVGWLLLGGKGAMALTTAVGIAAHGRMAIRIFAGRYRFDRQPLRGLGQALTRFEWELPQVGLGYLLAQWRNILGKVERVDTVDGVTFVTGRHWERHSYAGVSLGCFANMWVSDRIGEDFEGYARRSPFHIYGHEYGHTVDSQLWGWLYLPVVGLPSLISQALGMNPKARHRHESFWVERRADRLGEHYFERRKQDAQAEAGQA